MWNRIRKRDFGLSFLFVCSFVCVCIVCLLVCFLSLAASATITSALSYVCENVPGVCYTAVLWVCVSTVSLPLHTLQSSSHQLFNLSCNEVNVLLFTQLTFLCNTLRSMEGKQTLLEELLGSFCSNGRHQHTVPGIQERDPTWPPVKCSRCSILVQSACVWKDLKKLIGSGYWCKEHNKLKTVP